MNSKFSVVKKVTPTLIKKYDISNKIFVELADLQSRNILLSIMNKSKSAQEVASELKIPNSTAYKKIERLLELSLISGVKSFSDDGRLVKYYHSNIDDIKIRVSKLEPSISFKKNTKVKK